MGSVPVAPAGWERQRPVARVRYLCGSFIDPPPWLEHLPATGTCLSRAALRAYDPLTVILRMRRVGEAEAPRKTRSLPTASTSRSISLRLPAIVIS